MTNKNPITVSESDLAGIGMNQIAYLRQARIDGIDGYAIYAADGNVIGFAPNWVKAAAAVMQNELELVSLQ